MGFKKDFVWGAATSSYQIEGGAFADGKGLNIWDTFCKDGGKVFGEHNGDVACDHYNRVEEDVKLMAEMGLKAYRFSVDWARVIPNGIGEVNEKGIAFYNKLIDLLIKYGIEPYMTIYHWELPYALHLKGGWQNPEISDWFGKYSEVLTKNFSDRVTNFITINEPQIFVGLGYMTGIHAPGLKLSKRELLNVGKNVLLAHGKAVSALRKYAVQPVKIGIATASSPAIPFTDSDSDILACEKAFGQADINNFIYPDCFWLDPIVLGKFPDGIEASCKDFVASFSKEEMDIISQKIDFLGANIYSGNYTMADENGNPKAAPDEVGYPRTAVGWKITENALYWGARLYCNRYNLPYYITENGMSAHDVVSIDGKVHDPNRIDYMHRYLRGFRKACEEGYEVAGYFAWSLMDNFEWANGYSDRFGLIFVNLTTQQRILKDSALWYKSVIETNGENL